MSDKRTCHVCGKTFDGYGLRLWCSVSCESNYFEIASLESRLQAMTERAEEAERALVASREAIKTYCADANDMASEAVEIEAIEARAKALWLNEINGPFVAIARADVVALLAEVRKLREALARLVRRCEKDGICTPPCNCPYCRDFKKARVALGETKP